MAEIEPAADEVIEAYEKEAKEMFPFSIVVGAGTTLAILARLRKAERERDEAMESRHKQLAYAIDLQRIIEAICDGRVPQIPETTARFHYDMAVGFCKRTQGGGNG